MKQPTMGERLRTKKRLHDLRTGRINAPMGSNGRNVLFDLAENKSAYKRRKREARKKRIERRIERFQRRAQA